jgi:hypothetical protein
MSFGGIAIDGATIEHRSFRILNLLRIARALFGGQLQAELPNAIGRLGSIH